MGQSLNAWCDDDLDEASHKVEKQMEIPSVITSSDIDTSVIAPQVQGDEIDLSRLFEEYDNALKDYNDLLMLRKQIQTGRSMNRAIALEALAIYPDFDKHFQVNSFTSTDSSVGMEMALDNIDKGMAAMVAAAVVAIGVVIWKLIKVFGGSSKSKDGKNGTVDSDIKTIPTSAEAHHENENKAKLLEDIGRSTQDAIEELHELLRDAGAAIDGVVISSIKDIDTVFNAFLKMRDPDKNLSSFAPTSAIAASVKYSNTFHKDLANVYERSLAAADKSVEILSNAEAEIDELISGHGVFSQSKDRQDSVASSHASKVENIFSEANAKVVIDGKDVKDYVAALKATGTELETRFAHEAAAVTELSVLLHDFYSHEIKAQLDAVNVLSSKNDSVIALLRACDEMHVSFEKKAKNDSSALTPETSRVALSYARVMKNTITAIRDGGTYAHAVRDKWIDKTPPLASMMLAFIQHVSKNKSVRENEELQSDVRKIREKFESLISAIKEAGY